jgi:hypothetical protein
MIKALPFNYSHSKIMKTLFKKEFEDVKMSLILNNDYYTQKSKDILISIENDEYEIDVT